jgi:methanogenic corrinoid protein MtbC1
MTIQVLFADLKEEVLSLVKSKLEAGVDPSQILEDCIRGMHIIMERYEEAEYSLNDVIFATNLYKRIDDLLEPLLPREQRKYVGKAVVGVVKNDIHHTGSDLVADVLRNVGFQVFNQGVDVAKERFIDELKTTGASILCLSGDVGDAIPSMIETVKAVKQACPKVKVVIGGGITDENLRRYAGADAQSKDLVEGVRICLKIEAV